MRTVPLTQGKFALVDDESYGYLSKFKWHAHRDGGTFYARRKIPNQGESGPRQLDVYMHSEIMGFPVGVTHHFDGDGLNNLTTNLVATTVRGNRQGFMRKWGKASRFRGVSWNTHAGKWSARIKLPDRRIHLGYFEAEADAARAYNVAAGLYFGALGHLNKV